MKNTFWNLLTIKGYTFESISEHPIKEAEKSTDVLSESSALDPSGKYLGR